MRAPASWPEGRWVISDACIGLIESVAKPYPEADWQRCTVHFYRNVFSRAVDRLSGWFGTYGESD